MRAFEPRRARWRASTLVLVSALMAAAGTANAQDRETLLDQLPKLTITDRGDRGLWSIGTDVTVRWRSLRPTDERVRVQVSRDRGRTWFDAGRARATRGEITLPVRGPHGAGQVRVVSDDERTRSPARRVRFVAPIREISFSDIYGLALHEDGRVRFWGKNPYDYSRVLPRPQLVSYLSEVASIHAGGTAAVAIRKDGTAWYLGPSWTTQRSSRPRQIEGVTNALWGRTTYGRTYLRLADGRVLGFSDGSHGLPDGLLFEIEAFRDAVDIQLGDSHALALLPDGTVLSVGSNVYGQLGDGTFARRSEPAAVAGLVDVVAIGARQDSSMALDSQGRVFAWGSTHFYVEDDKARVPVEIDGMEDIVSIGCGASSSWGLRADGTVLGWGANTRGQLGDGSQVVPVGVVEALQHHVRRLFAGYGCVHVITSDGRRFGWGWNSEGRLGDGTTTDRASPVRIYSR